MADSESDDLQNPGWEMGIRIGEVATGWVTEFILYPWGDPRDPAGNGAEFVAVDQEGNIYGGEPRPREDSEVHAGEAVGPVRVVLPGGDMTWRDTCSQS